MSVPHDQACAVVALADRLDQGAAGPLAGELMGLRGRDLTLDAASVQRIGGPCLQVLLSARAAWAADGARFQIADASPAFREAVALMGSDLADPAPVQD